MSKKTSTKKPATKKAPAKKAAAPKATKKAASPNATMPATEKPAEKKATKTSKAKGEPKVKKISAIDAAVQVLAASKEPLSTKEMIEAMAVKGLWNSPGGKTPHATLYSAILREINAKGREARFKKTDRGRFTTNA